MAKWLSGFLVLGLLATFALAKDKTKNTLPPFVLQAHTVAVIIDPNAELSIDDPRANQEAQKDVQAALLKWGRFEPVEEVKDADLIVVVHRGNGRPMDDPNLDSRPNSGSGGISPGDRGGGPLGPQRGSPGMGSDPSLGPGQQGSRPQTEIRETEDSFAVFKSGDNPRFATPAWRYVATGGLSPQSVPAVAAFRKAVAAADKAAAAPKL